MKVNVESEAICNRTPSSFVIPCGVVRRFCLDDQSLSRFDSFSQPAAIRNRLKVDSIASLIETLLTYKNLIGVHFRESMKLVQLWMYLI